MMQIFVEDISQANTPDFLNKVIDPQKYYEHPSMSNSDLSELEEFSTGFDPTHAYAFGNLVDHLITEPEKVDVYQKTCDGYRFTQSDIDAAIKMKAAFMEDKFAKSIYENAVFQKIMYKRLHHEFGHIKFTLEARCKWDMWMLFHNWGSDIKTTTATTERQFIAACEYFQYFRQRFFYMTLAGSERDLIIGISKKNQKVFKVPIEKGDQHWQIGKEQYETLVVEYWKRYGGIN